MKPTPAQAEAIDTVDRHLGVDAGAGSGKTWVLIQRMLRLLESRAAALDEIVAITFTEAAAAEMKARLRAGCRDRAESPAVRHDPEAQSFWRELERRADTARISTIHGFCSALLREHALLHGLDPEFTILNEMETELLQRQVTVDAIHALLGDENPAAAAIAAEWGLNLLYGTLIAALNRRQVLDGISVAGEPDAVLSHWKACIQEANDARLMALAASPRLRRFEAELERFAGLCSNPKDAREVQRRAMADTARRLRHASDARGIRALVATLKGVSARGTRKERWASEEQFEQLSDLQKSFSDHLKQFEEIPFDSDKESAFASLTCAFHQVYQAVARAYKAEKAAQSAMDYDDLILETVKLFDTHAGARERAARGIRFLLVDEFQDTDYTQYRLARLLCDAPHGPKLFIVGDAKQSIYRFRGAEVEVFRDAAQAMPGRPVRLAANYRTVPEVLEFVNHFFFASGQLKEVEPNYAPMESQRSAAGACRVEFLLTALDEEGEQGAEAARRAEAELIAARIAGMCAGPCPAEIGDDREPARFGDVAILFRSMSNVHLYERSLQARGIPYQVDSGAGFYARPEVLDLRNLLTVVADPWNEMALLAFLRGPVAGIDDNDLASVCLRGSLARQFHADQPPDCLEHPERWAAARQLIAELRADRERPLPAFVRRVLERTGIEAVVLAPNPFTAPGDRKAANLRKLVDLAGEFAGTRTPTLRAFVRYLDELASWEIRESEAVLPPEDRGAVRIMTIHGAKGLEFPIVFIPDAARGMTRRNDAPFCMHRRWGLAVSGTDPAGERGHPALLKAVRDIEARRDEAESARLLYVAMTRARDWLIISGNQSIRHIERSWLAAFDSEYGIFAAGDGTELPITGDGGSGAGNCRCTLLVRRSAPASEPGPHRPEAPDSRPHLQPAAAKNQGAKPDREHVLRRVGPVHGQTPVRRVVAVTQLARAMTMPEDTGWKPAGHPSSAVAELDALVRGTAVHRFLERWDFQSAPDTLLDAVCREYAPMPRHARRLRATLEAIAEKVGGGPWARWLASDAAARREQRFWLRLDGSLVTGSIDVLFSGGTVLDYKTGRRHPDNEALYINQVLLYALAARALDGPVPARAVVLFVEHGDCIELDLDAARLDETEDRARAALARLQTSPGLAGATDFDADAAEAGPGSIGEEP